MRLCFVADARSPIARSWIGQFTRSGHEVHVISSHPTEVPLDGSRSLRVVPLAFSGLAAKLGRGRRRDSSRGGAGVSGATKMRPRLVALRYVVGALDVRRHAGRIRRIVEAVEADVVHALRIPFEGIAAAEALRRTPVPLALSVWGNDFTLHAGRNRLMASLTRRALERADAIVPDAQRDVELARAWGFDAAKLAVVLPSGGGIQERIFHPGRPSEPWRRELAIADDAPVVVNARGFRDYVRNDTFFRAIPQVLKQHRDVVFVCTGMQGDARAERWVARLGIAPAVRLLPILERDRLADLFRLAELTVSLTEHDGTPNTLLEAMACGAFPVAGDLESVREWIRPGWNGLLCEAFDPAGVAHAIVRALDDRVLTERARAANLGLVRTRADVGHVVAAASRLYARLTGARITGDDARWPLDGAFGSTRP
jgi:glycosyltransferase involved in cell wall biosynthesis